MKDVSAKSLHPAQISGLHCIGHSFPWIEQPTEARACIRFQVERQPQGMNSTGAIAINLVSWLSSEKLVHSIRALPSSRGHHKEHDRRSRARVIKIGSAMKWFHHLWQGLSRNQLPPTLCRLPLSQVDTITNRVSKIDKIVNRAASVKMSCVMVKNEYEDSKNYHLLWRQGVEFCKNQRNKPRKHLLGKTVPWSTFIQRP